MVLVFDKPVNIIVHAGPIVLVMHFLHPGRKRATRTRVRICAETYGFARQKTRGGSMNLILISWMSFLVDF